MNSVICVRATGNRVRLLANNVAYHAEGGADRVLEDRLVLNVNNQSQAHTGRARLAGRRPY
jgi:hypothetical protein